MDFARRLNWDAGKAVAHGLRRATASDLQAYSLRDIKEMSVAVLGVKPSGTKDALIALIVAAGVPAGVAFKTRAQTKRARLLGWGGSMSFVHSRRPTLLAASDAAAESAARRRSENVYLGKHGVGAGSTTYDALLAKAKRNTADHIVRKEQGDAAAFATRADEARISRERVQSMTDVCCICQVPVHRRGGGIFEHDTRICPSTDRIIVTAVNLPTCRSCNTSTLVEARRLDLRSGVAGATSHNKAAALKHFDRLAKYCFPTG